MFTAIALVAQMGIPVFMGDVRGPHKTLEACEARIEVLHELAAKYPSMEVISAKCVSDDSDAI